MDKKSKNNLNNQTKYPKILKPNESSLKKKSKDILFAYDKSSINDDCKNFSK